MHGHNRAYWRLGALADRPSRMGISLACTEILSERVRAHVVRPLIDVNELGVSSRLTDGFHGRDERMRDCDHRIALTDAGCDQRKTQCIGSASDADAVLRPTKSGEVALERFDLCTADESGGSERLSKRVDELL